MKYEILLIVGFILVLIGLVYLVGGSVYPSITNTSTIIQNAILVQVDCSHPVYTANASRNLEIMKYCTGAEKEVP